MTATQYMMVDPFGTDDGALAGVTPEDAFVLGVEWEMLRQTLDAERGEIAASIHGDNVPRIKAMVDRRGRSFRYRVTSKHWCEAFIGAAGAS